MNDLTFSIFPSNGSGLFAIGPHAVWGSGVGIACVIVAPIAPASMLIMGSGIPTPCIAPGAIPGGAQGVVPLVDLLLPLPQFYLASFGFVAASC